MIPVILITIAAVCEITLPKTNAVRVFFSNLSVTSSARCLLPLSSPFTLADGNGRTVEQVMDIVGESIGAIAMDCFIIAGGGASV